MTGATLGEAWVSVRTAARLGWAVESNWTDPVLFVIYSVAKPLSAALILVLMFSVITGGQRPEYLAFLVVGSALWNIVYGALAGLVLSVLEDRERYRMLKYVAVTPASLFPFLVGRGASRIVISLAGLLITLAVGVVFLGVELDLAGRPALLLVSTLLGFAVVVAFGIAMAGLCLQLRQDSWSYPEAVAGALYLISGAVFPIDVLPGPMQPVALALPITWWLEGSRRALIGSGAPGQLSSLSDLEVGLLLGATSAVFVPLCLYAYRRFERRARERGLIDMTTGS